MKLEPHPKETYDFDHVIRRLMGETSDGPIPLVECSVDIEIMVETTGIDFPVEKYGKLINLARLTPGKIIPELKQLRIRYLDLMVAFNHSVGYDYLFARPAMPIKLMDTISTENPLENNKSRNWQEEHQGIITNRDQFEAFHWPDMAKIKIKSLDYTPAKLAPGQKLLVFLGGIFEYTRPLMGLETLAIKSKDAPRLVDDLAEKLTQIVEVTVDKAAAHSAAGAIFYADDMGYNNGPFLSPGIMREIFFPKLKRIVDACHKHNKPFLLHSCGNIEPLMEDLIEMVGIDARHSFQDNAERVEPFYKKYRDRIGVVGGLDVNLLTRGTPEAVRARTREILDVCGSEGRYVMGSGNSVTNYCNIENFYAMIDETRKWNEQYS